jgi:hypothetical protein
MIHGFRIDLGGLESSEAIPVHYRKSFGSWDACNAHSFSSFNPFLGSRIWWLERKKDHQILSRFYQVCPHLFEKPIKKSFLGILAWNWTCSQKDPQVFRHCIFWQIIKFCNVTVDSPLAFQGFFWYNSISGFVFNLVNTPTKHIVQT